MPPDSTETVQDDYAVIEAAVMETARGRWFLAEYARRARADDTATVLDALGRIEKAVAAPRSGIGDSIRLELVDMANAIARTKAEIAAIRPEGDHGPIGDATSELDAIVKATETATGDILAAAEHLQEVAWTMREAGAEGAACDIIDQRATDIYMACSFQDITGQRTQKVIQVLRYIENRIAAMMSVWSDGESAVDAGPPPPPLSGGDGLLNGPALPGHGLDQTDVDSMMVYDPANPGFDPLVLDDLPPVSLPETDADLVTPAEPVPDAVPVAVADADNHIQEHLEAVDIKAETDVVTVLSETAPSPFSPVVKPRAKSRRLAEGGNGRPTLDDVDALSFDEKTALFS